MSRTRVVGWLVLFGAVCSLTPGFQSTASAFGRNGPCQQKVCIQYVYVPCYIEKVVYVDRVVPGPRVRGPEDEKTPKIHFFLVMDTEEVGELGLQISRTERRIRELHGDIPTQFRGEIRSVRPEDMRATKIPGLLKKFAEEAGVRPMDTLMVFCNTHGETASKAAPKQADEKKDDAKKDEPKKDDAKPDDKKADEPKKDDAKPAADPKAFPGLADDKFERLVGEEPNQFLLMWSRNREANTPALQKLPDREWKLKREDLRTVLKDVDCRLKLLITDACFVPAAGGRPKFGTVQKDLFDVVPDDKKGPDKKDDAPPVTEYKVNEKKSREALRDLFVNHEGQLDLNSASPGEIALVQTFSDAFTEMIRGNPNYEYGITWTQFKNQLQDRVNERLNSLVKRKDYESTAAKMKELKQFDEKGQKFVQRIKVFTDEKGKEVVPTPANWEDSRARGTKDGKLGPKGDDDGDIKKRSDAAPANPGLAPGGVTPPAVPAPSPVVGAPLPPANPAVAAPVAASPPAPANPAPPRPGVANVTINLPAEAALFLNGIPTKQAAATRYFQTPVLDPGESVTYTFRAELTVNGEKVTETKEVVLQPGKEVAVTFDLKAAATPAPAGGSP